MVNWPGGDYTGYIASNGYEQFLADFSTGAADITAPDTAGPEGYIGGPGAERDPDATTAATTFATTIATTAVPMGTTTATA